MPPSFVNRLFSAALLALAAAGCTHPSDRSVRSATSGAPDAKETLRSVRQPLVIARDTQSGHAILEIPDSHGVRTVSLYLNPKDEARLRAARTGANVEIRYWEQLKHVFPDAPKIPVGELESVIEGTRVLLDRSYCELHDLKMPRKPAPILYGRASSTLIEAWIKFFPNAAIALGGSVVAEDSPETEIKYVCPDCEETYAQWTETRPL